MDRRPIPPPEAPAASPFAPRPDRPDGKLAEALDWVPFQAREFYLDETVAIEVARRFRYFTTALAQDARRGREPITIVINSPGGDVDAMIDIITQIRRLAAAGTPVHALIISRAESAATAIALTCSRVVMSGAGRMMIHGPSFASPPIDVIDHEALVAVQARIAELIVELILARARRGTIYARRRSVEAIMRSRHHHNLTAAEALAAGLIDEILPVV